MKRIIISFLALSILSFGSYEDAIKYYNAKEYSKAFTIILKEANSGTNKAAEYRLATMYENGEGTKVDLKKAMFWYKSSASKYSFVTEVDSQSKPITVVEKLKKQVNNDELNSGQEYALGKIDTKTIETKRMFDNLLHSDIFGIEAYKTNYIMPLSYAKDKPRRISANSANKNETYNENTEVEFQFSLKKELSYNLFGFNEYVYAAYTQKVWWQLYDESGPFRETNYMPELYVTVPTSQTIDDMIDLKIVTFGFIHESNGQEGYRSRSWNRLYVSGLWQWDNLFVSARAWYRLEEDKKSDEFYEGKLTFEEALSESSGDDNPDILDYMGYGDLNIAYLYERHKFNLMLRNNFDFDDNKYAVEFAYSYPLFGSDNTYVYAKVFTGYGESLIDYDVDVTKVSFGLSFGQGLFQ
ncbi:Phospholipase A1 precursor,; Outer membrane phospholipase A [hydrothermal vent metagenome]|uniref:Phosphatidylcholine 1-acylhydrolase n=1 Tax=hydrothermal vent metagenome TaxID=652676 RepID=A0A1W1EC32_9ZZZZ